MDVSSHGVSRANQLLLAVAAAAIVLCATGAASMMGLIPNAGSKRAAEPVAMAADSHAITSQCSSCGTVTMIRTFELHDDMAFPIAAKRGPDGERSASKRFVYRVTVHMDDGSYRTFSQSAPPGYGVGTQVKVLKGALTTRT